MKDVATEAEYDQAIAEIKRLLRKSEAKLSPEEDRLLDLLSTLAEHWEVVLRQNLIPTPNASHWSHITLVNMLYPVSPSY